MDSTTTSSLCCTEDKHWWLASRTRALQAMMDRALPGRDLTVLDVGRGAGNMIDHMLKETGDIDSTSVNCA
jgi:ubiquinone/menaquinone biosynthesis C-methylase UbiE